MSRIIKVILLAVISHGGFGQNITVSFELEERCICLGMPGIWTAILKNTSDTTITIYPKGIHNGEGMKYMYDVYAVDKYGDTLSTQSPGLMLGGGRHVEVDVKKDSSYRETAFITDYFPIDKPGNYEVGFTAWVDIKGKDGRNRVKGRAISNKRLRVRKCRDRTISKRINESVQRILMTDTLGLELDGEGASMLDLESTRLAKSRTKETFSALEQIIEFSNLFVIVNAKRGMQKIDPLKAQLIISNLQRKYGEECEQVNSMKGSIRLTAKNQRCLALFQHN